MPIDTPRDRAFARRRTGTRRLTLAVAALALFALAAAPTRRSTTGGCNGFNGCGPGTNPRSLKVVTPDWNDQTVLPNGASSWDIGFQRTDSAAHPEQASPAPYKIEWAGDATSSLVMLRDSTDRSCSLEGFSFTGIIPGSTPYSNGLTQYAYTELDWAGITGKLNISPSAASADFDTTFFSSFSVPDPSVPAWPNSQRSGVSTVATTSVSPYFRIYDHGVCSINVPWLVDPNDPMQNNIPYPSIGAILSGGLGTIPVNQVQTNTIVPFFLVNKSTVTSIDFGIYPDLKNGSQPPDDTVDGETFPDVRNVGDTLVVGGDATFFEEFDQGFDQSPHCYAQSKLTFEYRFTVAQYADFPKRIQIDAVDHHVNTSVDPSQCSLTGLPYALVIPPVISKELPGLMQTAQSGLQYTLNSILTPPLPTAAELFHWLKDTCNPDTTKHCFVPAKPDPNATDVGTATCVRRVDSPSGANPTVVNTGALEMAAWAAALVAGQGPPDYTLTTSTAFDGQTGARDTTCSGPPGLGAPQDTTYKGCLGRDLKPNVNLCGQMLTDYRNLVSLVAPALPPASAAAIKDLVANLHMDDLECRPLDPTGIDLAAANGDLSSVVNCPNDNPAAPLCTPTAFYSAAAQSNNAQANGFPPDALQCGLHFPRKLPRDDPGTCNTLLNYCGGGGYPGNTDPQCLDYWLFCGTFSDYCDLSGIPQSICQANADDERCLERLEYCGEGGVCQSSSPVFSQCDNQPPPTYDCPPPDSLNTPFRSDCQVQQVVCSDYNLICHNGCSGEPRGSPSVPRYWCGLRLPVTRLNFSPEDFEVVLDDGDSTPDAWYQVLSDFEALLNQVNAPLRMCNASDGTPGGRNFNRAGVVGRAVAAGNPP